MLGVMLVGLTAIPAALRDLKAIHTQTAVPVQRTALTASPAQVETAPQPEGAMQAQNASPTESAAQVGSAPQPEAAAQAQSTASTESAAPGESTPQPEAAQQAENAAPAEGAAQVESMPQPEAAQQAQGAVLTESAAQLDSTPQPEAPAQAQNAAPTESTAQVERAPQSEAAAPIQTTAQTDSGSPAQNAPQAQSETQVQTASCSGHPDALGTSRVIAVDPNTLKRVGRMQYPESLPLNDKEVVITFDDGPLPPYSNQILDILASECVKATYFLVGSMAHAYPAVVRRVYEEGHTIGTHSDNHPSHFSRLAIDKLRHEIDRGIADVSAALGDSKYLAPFFRVPGLDRSELIESELAARGLIVFSSDTVADDWHHGIRPKDIAALALRRLEARGKGILLLHDIHQKTVAALPDILKGLKDNGFHVVQVVPSAAYLIAMALKPNTHRLASATPEELVIGQGLDGAHRPEWPAPLPESSADVNPGNAALPVPEATAFEPDSGVADEARDAHWPEQPAKASMAEARSQADDQKHAHASEREGQRHSAAGDNDREPHKADRIRSRRHAKSGNDDTSGDVVSRIKSFAALLSSAPQPAH